MLSIAWRRASNNNALEVCIHIINCCNNKIIYNHINSLFWKITIISYISYSLYLLYYCCSVDESFKSLQYSYFSYRVWKLILSYNTLTNKLRVLLWYSKNLVNLLDPSYILIVFIHILSILDAIFTMWFILPYTEE